MALCSKHATKSLVIISSGEIVAIKKLKSKYSHWEQCVNLPEVKSLIQLAHPNIVALIEIIKEGELVCFVFEFLEMNVYDYMKSREKVLNEIQIRNIIFQTLQGLAYMHSHNYIHRDIKPENLLYFHDTIKIADFGLITQ